MRAVSVIQGAKRHISEFQRIRRCRRMRGRRSSLVSFRKGIKQVSAVFKGGSQRKEVVQ